jgi:hypothetical protein
MECSIMIRLAMAVMLLATAVNAYSVPPAMAKSGGDLVKVTLDVDVYAQPGGVGKPIGVLRENSQVELINQRKDHWCNVQGAAVPAPGNFGWVWCGIGEDGQDFSLKPVTANAPANTGGDMTEPTAPTGSGGAGGGAAGE